MEREAVFTVRGLVLRCTDVGETDRMLTVLTKDEGKLSVCAKGARRLTAGSLSSAQLFAYADFTIRRGKGDLYYLQESSVIETFHKICETFSGQALAVYLCEIAEELTYPGGEAGGILQLTLNALWTIAEGNKPEFLVKGAYELRAAAIDGYYPDLRACCACGKGELNDGGVLDIMNGRLLCPGCYKELYEQTPLKTDPGGIPTDGYGTAFVVHRVTGEALSAMRYVLSAPAKRQFSFAVPKSGERGFSSACEEYLLNHVGHSYKSLGYYKSTGDMMRLLDSMAADARPIPEDQTKV